MKKVILSMMLMSLSAISMAKENITLKEGVLVLDETKLSFKGKSIKVDEDAASLSVKSKFVVENKDVVLLEQMSATQSCSFTCRLVEIFD